MFGLPPTLQQYYQRRPHDSTNSLSATQAPTLPTNVSSNRAEHLSPVYLLGPLVLPRAPYTSQGPFYLPGTLIPPRAPCTSQGHLYFPGPLVLPRAPCTSQGPLYLPEPQLYLLLPLSATQDTLCQPGFHPATQGLTKPPLDQPSPRIYPGATHPALTDPGLMSSPFIT